MRGSDLPAWLQSGPLLLDPGNFTPRTRTPWGGYQIGREFKASVLPQASGQQIGESWEFSCDPDFPSLLVGLPADAPKTLPELVRRFPEAVLSPALSAHSQTPSCEILLKLLNAAAPLSLQVHPTDADPSLAAHECGKPESWLILSAEEGAGIYLGFAKKMQLSELRARLQAPDPAPDFLHFEPVKAGDYFEIGPGVPHAIGRGVTLLEPQRILPFKSGKTLRLWDFGRRYDSEGRLDANGQPRPLHVEAGLALVDPLTQVGKAYAASLRRQAHFWQLESGAEVQAFPANPYYRLYLISIPETKSLSLSIDKGYGVLLMLKGRCQWGQHTLTTGQPALLPHAAMPLAARALSSSQLALVVPARADVQF